MVDSDELIFNRGGILGKNLERASVVKDAVGLIQPVFGVYSRAKGLHCVRQDLGIFRYVAIEHRLHPF
jgi:hypothetical protein